MKKNRLFFVILTVSIAVLSLLLIKREDRIDFDNIDSFVIERNICGGGCYKNVTIQSDMEEVKVKIIKGDIRSKETELQKEYSMMWSLTEKIDYILINIIKNYGIKKPLFRKKGYHDPGNLHNQTIKIDIKIKSKGKIHAVKVEYTSDDLYRGEYSRAKYNFLFLNSYIDKIIWRIRYFDCDSKLYIQKHRMKRLLKKYKIDANRELEI